MSTIFRWLRKVAILLACLYLLLTVSLMFLEESLLFFPTKSPGGDWNPKALAVENAEFQAADGVKLHGWYVPCENAKAAVLFFHGNGGNITHRMNSLVNLHRIVGVSTLILDYRGYGRSEGKPNEKGILLDARAARTWLAKRENIAEKEIVLMGESLGGGVAVDLAAQDGAKALVLVSTFNRLPDVAAYHYPAFPVKWLMRTQLDSERKIPNYRGPLLQYHGKKDTVVPFNFGKKLFDAANEPKELVVSETLDHNDSPPEMLYLKMRKLLEGMASGK
jgi:fermentation-respiration switch protein FrsA (DUF1100 family)